MATPLDTRIPPPLWALGLGVTQWLLAGRPDYRRRPGSPRFLLAGTVGTASAVLGIAAVSEFLRRGTTVHPGTPEHASALVTERVYRFTRNPMYLSLAGALVSNAAWLGAVRAVWPIAALTGILTAFQILPEERALQERFGEAYEDYRRRVPRWVGLPRRRRRT
ncbi:methyltransferase family protein [Raineyella fluvialis]|uniref:Isoprenylcysteine carboxylmethyltransferase family protein n=1 Tax=Raineyella fluvialis TaxID=2662261 RepID=A0A5Q2FDD3_9ACTN|nr:isoprenylcysteine carboxylmethyltransferase family protein [Raineyella fluvialis]QGF23797.1 isoprenylcysteine carboxylmethyltransferase family protein [Raineyella fluvialis]